jgi:hypothetical protein
MPTSKQTLKELNEANSRFWREQRSSFDKRMANDAIRETAFEALQAQMLRAVPLPYQVPLEQLLQDADRAGRRFSIQQARNGGTARKADALQLLIEKIVTRQPDISENQLLEKLEAYQATRTIIQAIEDGAILFTSNSGKHKEAPVSGLKDRLTRAKKKVRSR